VRGAECVECGGAKFAVGTLCARAQMCGMWASCGFCDGLLRKKLAGFNESGSTMQWVSFRLGSEEYGVEILAVREIILLGPITRMPQSPPYVRGLINLRSSVIPIIDLRLRFGMPEQEATEDSRIMVVDVAGKTMGMIVDAVSQVLRVSPQKKVLLSTRLQRRLKATGIDCYTSYMNHLRKLPAGDSEWNAFLQEITTHESYLFRDQVHWDWFRNSYLLQISKDASSGKRISPLSICRSLSTKIRIPNSAIN